MKVRGFVTNMAEWMTACDTIITKAGPGTIAEALICGLPIILNGFIPCQVSTALFTGQAGGFEIMLQGHHIRLNSMACSEVDFACRKKATCHLLSTTKLVSLRGSPQQSLQSCSAG